MRAQVDEGAYAFVAISDTGMGMSDEVKQRIFEPFYTTKEMTRGTGLGLAIVYGIVKQHRGFIEVESSVGRGTTFKVCLPYVPDAKNNTETALPALDESHRGTERLLVVEDDADIRDLIKDILSKAGYRVDVASNGSDALRSLSSAAIPFDMVISDIVMPGMNGAEFSEQARRAFPTIKVLLITGHAEAIINKYGIIEQKVPLLEKPFDRKTLLMKVRAELAAGVHEG